MEEKQRGYFDFKIIVGLLVIAAGVILVLQNMGVVAEFNVWDYWPLPFIFIGLGKIITPSAYRHVFGGFIILAVATLLLLNNLDLIQFDIGDLWPVFLILIGFAMIRGSVFHHHCKPDDDGDPDSGKGPGRPHRPPHPPDFSCMGATKRQVDTDHINVSAILGGGEYKFNNKTLKGGKATAIMGGCVIDLTDADMTEDQIELNTFAFWGGIEVKVPKTWDVVMKGSPILGGMEVKTASPETPDKQLVVTGSAIMGGVDIKN
jgi:hypothetical protein